jgi:hypothetical protein
MRSLVTLGAAAVAAGLACAPANGQSLTLMTEDIYRPAGGVALDAPRYFEGMYAGVLVGASGADHRNFYSNGNIDRVGVGGVVGYNIYLTPEIIVGGEVQGHVETDLGGAFSTIALAMGHFGLLTADDFQVYLTGGGGLFDGVPAWAVGAGFEWGIYDNIAWRGEILSIGQAGASPTGISIPGVTAWMIKTGAIWHFGEESSAIPGWHLSFDPPASVTDFDGGYIGASYGIINNPGWNFFPNTGFGLHQTRGDISAIAGWNWRLADMFVAGVEGQAGWNYDTSGDITYNVFGLGRAGFVPWEGTMVYGAAGVGVLQHKGAYALGGGVEHALWGEASLRAELLALGEFGQMPTASKFSVGALWHY